MRTTNSLVVFLHQALLLWRRQHDFSGSGGGRACRWRGPAAHAGAACFLGVAEVVHYREAMFPGSIWGVLHPGSSASWEYMGRRASWEYMVVHREACFLGVYGACFLGVPGACRLAEVVRASLGLLEEVVHAALLLWVRQSMQHYFSGVDRQPPSHNLSRARCSCPWLWEGGCQDATGGRFL